MPLRSFAARTAGASVIYAEEVRFAFAPHCGLGRPAAPASQREGRPDARNPAGALRGLLNGSFALGGKLTRTTFDVLTEVIGSADVYCLTYSRLQDAIVLIQKVCR